VPSLILIVVMCVVGLCAVPSATMFSLMAVKGGPGVGMVLVIGVPALIGYPVAAWLASRSWRAGKSGRTGGRRQAWMLAGLGLLLVAGTSVLPAGIVGQGLVEVWEETQPGGRGYVPPTGSR
jgi:hypothetical protein